LTTDEALPQTALWSIARLAAKPGKRRGNGKRHGREREGGKKRRGSKKREREFSLNPL